MCTDNLVLLLLALSIACHHHLGAGAYGRASASGTFRDLSKGRRPYMRRERQKIAGIQRSAKERERLALPAAEISMTNIILSAKNIKTRLDCQDM